MDLEPGSPLTALAVVAAIIAVAMQLGLAEPARPHRDSATSRTGGSAPLALQQRADATLR